MSVHSSGTLLDLANQQEVLRGAFVEQPFHRHVEPREALLRCSEWLPEPAALRHFAIAAEQLPAQANVVREALRRDGIVKLSLDRELSNAELIAFGGSLGTVMVHDTSPRLREQVEDAYVLHLRQEYEETPEYDLALISRNYLTLHSEVCVKAIAMQPRLIMLHCVEPSPPDTGGQTLFVPMAAVYDRLQREHVGILRDMNFAEFPHSPPFLSWREDRPVFSFRDFGTDILYWRYVGPDERLSVAQVNAAIRALLATMYDPELIFGIDWHRGDVLVFDNWFFFHGRTFIFQPSGARRHFKNLKIG